MRLEDVKVGEVYRYKRHPASPEHESDSQADGCLVRVVRVRKNNEIYTHRCEVVRGTRWLGTRTPWNAHYLSLHPIEAPPLPGKFSEWVKSCRRP